MDLLARRLERQNPESNQGISVQVYRFNEAYNGGPIRVLFLSLLGAVGFVLLIACANVAGLMLSRTLARSREISIRAALGASRARVMFQLLIECILYSVCGGLLGLAIAAGGVRAFRLAVAAVNKPYWIHFTVDLNVFAYVAAITLGAGVLFGLFPAWTASHQDIGDRLKEGTAGAGTGHGPRLLTRALVITELALTVVLLTGAGLMIRSFLKIYAVQKAE